MQRQELGPGLRRGDGNREYPENAMHSIALLLALAAVPAAPAPPPNAPTCDAPEHRQFDFWVGEWSVVGKKAGKVVGHSRIESALGGCLIVETWTGGAQSRSLNLYNRDLGAWEQFWVDSQGNRLQLQGGLRDGAMVLETPPLPDGTAPRRRDRITWTPDAQGRVRQVWTVSVDGGEWAVQFDGLYSREPGR
jgi:hypothetical protein